MFDRLKKALGMASAPTAPAVSRTDSRLLASWALQRGYRFFEQNLRSPDGHARGEGFVMDGSVQSKPWHLECGLPGRDFVHGHELRARSELGLIRSVAVVVMSRPLKLALEKRAYALYTDSLQTAVDPQLPEEMRWLAVFPEVGWPGLPEGFSERYAILAARREHATAWVTSALAKQLLQWPAPGLAPEVPLVLTLQHGKCYLRMEYSTAAPAIVQHAVDVFLLASEEAMRGVSPAAGPGAESADGALDR